MSDLANLIALQEDNIARAKALNSKRSALASGLSHAIVLIWLGASLGTALMVADHKFAAIDRDDQEVVHVAR